jgi:hypothetical protein
MGDVKRKDSNTPLQPYHVFLEDGRTVPIEATGFDQVVNIEEQIIFRDADGKPIDEIFCRAAEVALIVPESRIAKSHAFIDLQKKVSDLTERLGLIEKAVTSTQPPSGE